VRRCEFCGESMDRLRADARYSRSPTASRASSPMPHSGKRGPERKRVGAF
jgi:hypothetical protein